jgi:hypothetical protein
MVLVLWAHEHSATVAQAAVAAALAAFGALDHERGEAGHVTSRDLLSVIGGRGDHLVNRQLSLMLIIWGAAHQYVHGPA